MSVLLEFSMTPLGIGESVSAYVARSLAIIDASGLEYELHAMGTIIEGEPAEVLSVMQQCLDAMSQDCDRVSCVAKLDYRKGASGRLASKVEKVEQLVGRPLSTSAKPKVITTVTTVHDYVIVGGGIVGLATAYQLQQKDPQCSILLLEKEAQVGAHQTGHNSGVLHSGIYYKPGSLKATNCRDGRLAMIEFCEREGIAYDICGKVIVAVDAYEIPALKRIYQRGQENGVACEIIDRDPLRELEPHVAGVQAIHVPEAGIVNFRRVCERLAAILQEQGHSVRTAQRVVDIDSTADHVRVTTSTDEFAARHLINCAGLQNDRVAKMAGAPPADLIVPFRGEYFDLVPSAQHLCRNLIYPVPDPEFPFLGVHFTRMIDDGVECGPNAVLAFAREGYKKTDIDVADLLEAVTYPGFIRLAMKHWKMGAGEMYRSLSKRAFVKALRRLIPEIKSEDLVPARAGVRAQAVRRSGQLVDDFVVDSRGRFTHVSNAPSPAATSSLNIGKLIVEQLPAFAAEHDSAAETNTASAQT